jgi:hypothetical protein
MRRIVVVVIFSVVTRLREINDRTVVLYCRGAVYIQVYTWFPKGCDPWVVTANGWA